MDGNKDEALKCLKIGKDALEAGDRARALKFVTKARRLDPNLPVDDLLSAIERETGQSETPAGGANDEASKASDHPSVRHRVPSSGSSASSSSSSVAYTEEQISIVRQVKKKKDYYEVLGLEKSCTVEDIRKAYRKLSLKVHPDKNKAPGAEEAFKAVSKAFQCLSNEESRKKYDLVGSDEPVYERHPATRRANGFNGFYDGDVDAEEIFRNFFFGGMPQATTQFRGFAFGPGMGTRTEPMYAFARSYPYEYRFVTQKGVNYYVKSTKFEQDYPSNSHERVAFEARVEREYFALLSQNCRHELQRLQWGFIRETPHCDMLKQFEAVA
ncbi:chaperone protein dnaJ 49-like isoform X2 [Vitis riparia]|uniref:chaperone protein dnaJ 49-like isoform X2 n=1 Tax=Vitis riparia TaxID=96939 RepID=UPI0008FED48E|nr:chaperone protein dnaJ 49-like isoform X2 [Vitis riparia]XP_059596868.1 chaperone protein dnaJ 49 isoform X2 [Vitis vinifera]XP_059596869.1 chaperone protein dnaJ 49 isoform X2 [Vitis vinifera]|eukprot:XP_019078626.1 PREDICTED: chaperone protein dnaJ 49 isoform X2 [Vitis vinifera]